MLLIDDFIKRYQTANLINTWITVQKFRKQALIHFYRFLISRTNTAFGPGIRRYFNTRIFRTWTLTL